MNANERKCRLEILDRLSKSYNLYRGSDHSIVVIDRVLAEMYISGEINDQQLEDAGITHIKELILTNPWRSASGASCIGLRHIGI